MTTKAPTLERLRSVATVSLTEAGAFLGLSTSAVYRAADRGDVPTVSVNGRRRVPTPRLLALVGLTFEPHHTPTTARTTPGTVEGVPDDPNAA